MSLLDHIAKSGPEMVPIPGSTMTEFPKARPMEEIGVSGLQRTRGTGYVFEEWLNALSTYRAKQVFREMRDNDPVIGAMFFALEMILRKAEWTITPAKGKEGDKIAEFVKSCMDDMSHTFEDFICECVSEFAFGFSLFETVYKRRKGSDGRQASKFDDGLIGWRKFAPRAQESILYWMWDDAGGLQGAVQLAAPDYRTVPMPIEKLLLFRTTSLKNNPEGRSLLRNCYRPWYFKRRIEEVEGIGIERDLCGIPVLYASAEALQAMGGINSAKTLVRNIRIDDQMGVVLPLAMDEKGNKMVDLQLLKASGSKLTDPGAAIARYNSDILNTMLAGFIQLGQTPTGSFSLHMSASQIFAQAIGAFMDATAAVLNRIAIPRLLNLNNMDLESAPKLEAGEIGVRDLEDLSNFVQKLSMSGLTFFDKPTENYLRKAARLPEAPEDDQVPQAPGPNNPQVGGKVPPEPNEDGGKPGAPQESQPNAQQSIDHTAGPNPKRPAAAPAQTNAEGNKKLQQV